MLASNQSIHHKAPTCESHSTPENGQVVTDRYPITMNRHFPFLRVTTSHNKYYV